MSLEKRILKLAQKYDFIDDLIWDQDLKFAINCNDVFMWGCADAEEIETEEDVNLLQQACEDSNDWGHILYCARKQGMRPQGSYYEYLYNDEWELFNACGPKREVCFGNPKNQGE
jgi:hypothetical protein